jgi:hypothetical protein
MQRNDNTLEGNRRKKSLMKMTVDNTERKKYRS